MSGIYINGMKMPKGCATCPYCNRTWNKPKCKAKSIQGRFMEQKLNLDRTRQKWCPLVPVPPHGRLIDADALYTELAKRKSYGELSAKSALRAVANAPTIIQASGKDTDVPTREEGE